MGNLDQSRIAVTPAIVATYMSGRDWCADRNYSSGLAWTVHVVMDVALCSQVAV